MSFEPQTTTYRGESLEELLPQIRDDLGADAVIVRQREGIVGGVGGFFGKKCVEVEARPAAARPSVPPRAVVNAYDTGDREDGAAELGGGNPLVDTLMAQTSPFVEQLSEALSRQPPAEREREPDVDRAPEPAPQAEAAPPVPRPSLLADLAARPVRRPARLDEVTIREPALADEASAVRAALEAAGIPVSMVDEIVAEVELTLRPFEPLTSFRELARRALARRIDVAFGWRTKRRTIALIGLEGSGRTLTTAKLAHAYARAGRPVTALSLEPARDALHLSELTARAGVGLEIADSPEAIALAKRRMRDSEIVVVDTPPIADPVDGRRIKPMLRLLDALKPDETHLLIAAGADLTATRAFIGSLTRHIVPTRILITHADVRPHTGVGVGMSLAERVPVSFIGEGDRPAGGITIAEPVALARMVLA
jgi:flagellar biosynthesis GTPase FlhF